MHTEVSFDALEGLCRQLRAELAADPGAYAGVVVDSLSEVQRALIEQDAPGRFRLTQGDYGENTAKLRLLCRHFRDLPCHSVFITHVRRDQDDDGEVHFGPALTPAVAGDLLGFVDIACYCRAAVRAGSEEPEYVGAFRPGRKFTAKDRYGLLPPRLVSPTFDRILAYVCGRYTRGALQAFEKGERREDLDILQYEYRQRMNAAESAATTTTGA